MLRAGVGLSTTQDPRKAAEEATALAMVQAGLRYADAAICFISSAHGAAYPLVVRTISEVAQTPQIAGCSAAGVIGSGDEVERGYAISVLVVGGGDVAARRLFVPDLRGRDAEVGHEIC